LILLAPIQTILESEIVDIRIIVNENYWIDSVSFLSFPLSMNLRIFFIQYQASVITATVVEV